MGIFGMGEKKVCVRERERKRKKKREECEVNTHIIKNTH